MIEGHDGVLKGNAKSDWKAWTRYCAWAGIMPWRTDATAAIGTNPEAQEREVVIWINALLYIYPRMKNAPGRVEPPKPTSALAILRSIRRMHQKLDLPVVQLTPVVRAMKKLMEQYRDEHGAEALQLHRKEPLSNTIVSALIQAESGKPATIGARSASRPCGLHWHRRASGRRRLRWRPGTRTTATGT